MAANNTEAVTIQNILVGYGDLFYADFQTPLPDFAAAGNSDHVRLQQAFAEDTDWNYAGATQEGVELAYSPEYGEVEIDQFKDAALLWLQQQTVSLNTNLVEATLENLLIAWGIEDDYLQQAGSGKVSQFSIGVYGEDAVERSVAVVGKGNPTLVTTGTPPNDVTSYVKRDRVYLGRRVLSIEGASLAMRRTEATTYPVSLRMLPDPSFKNSEYGLILDRIPGDATENPDADPIT
jgi:hypothetical protein